MVNKLSYSNVNVHIHDNRKPVINLTVNTNATNKIRLIPLNKRFNNTHNNKEMFRIYTIEYYDGCIIDFRKYVEDIKYVIVGIIRDNKIDEYIAITSAALINRLFNNRGPNTNILRIPHSNTSFFLDFLKAAWLQNGTTTRIFEELVVCKESKELYCNENKVEKTFLFYDENHQKTHNIVRKEYHIDIDNKYICISRGIPLVT